MRVSIWQQFSSNNSSDFTVVGVFETPEAAQRGAAEVQSIIDTLKTWYDEHPDQAEEIFSSGGYPPSPAEVETGKRFGFEWEQAVEWYWHASVQVVLDRLVYVTTTGFRPDTAGEPFEKILTGLGGQGLLHGDNYGTQIGTILADITCAAPDEETAREIVKRYLAFERLGRSDGTKLHLYDWNFAEFDLPQLIAELEGSGCTDIRYHLYQSDNPNEKVPGVKDVDLLIELLGSPDSYDKEKIADALGEIGDPQAVDALVRALQGADRIVRIRIAAALGKIGDPRAVEALIQLLDDQDVLSAAHAAAGSLAKIGDPRAIEPLVASLSKNNAHQQAADALAEFGEVARAAVMAAQESTDPVLHYRAMEVLARLDELQTDGELLAALRSGQPIKREEALKRAVANRDLDVLLAYLHNPRDGSMLNAVVEALGDLGDVRAVEPLTQALRTMITRDAIVNALMKLGAPPVELLIGVIRDEQAAYWMREHALWVLSRLGDPRAFEVFTDVLDRKLQLSLGKAVIGLARMRDQRAIQTLSHLLVSKLGDWHFTSTDYYPPLKEALTQAGALGEVTDALLEALGGSNPDKQWHAAWILGELGEPRAIEPLRALLDEADPQWRKIIQEALGKLGAEPGS